MPLTLKDALLRAGARLHAAEVETAMLDARVLLCHALRRPREFLIAHPDYMPSEEESARFDALIQRRAAREPVAYLTGEREFWGMAFEVTPDVLVPRPDSETLVEAVLEAFPDRDAPLHVVDFGTGSGCLLLAILSEFPKASGVGVDISDPALAIAKRNGCKLRLDARVTWRQGTWANGMQPGCADMVVTNPPYIPLSDSPGLAPDVREFEPHTALFAGQDGLDAYRALAADIAAMLAPRGKAFVEIGAGQAEDVAGIMNAADLACETVRRDLAGHARVLVLSRHQGKQ